jgi:RNA binding exosome subunit
MKHKDYKKLMKLPFEDLSEEDQNKRKKEFHRRLEVAQMFLNGIVKGYINNDIEKLMEDDDPMKETVKLVKLQINEVNGMS